MLDKCFAPSKKRKQKRHPKSVYKGQEVYIRSVVVCCGFIGCRKHTDRGTSNQYYCARAVQHSFCHSKGYKERTHTAAIPAVVLCLFGILTNTAAMCIIPVRELVLYAARNIRYHQIIRMIRSSGRAKITIKYNQKSC